MLSTKVKASAITHLTDARYFAAMYVDWLGFHLSPGSDESVNETLVIALKEWVDGVRICGEFGLATAAELTNNIRRLALDAVQLGPFTPLDALAAVPSTVEVIQEVVIEHYNEVEDIEELLVERAEYAQYFLLNFSKGGLSWRNVSTDEIPFSLAQLQSWCQRYPILLDLPLEGTAPTEVLAQVPAKGFSVQGSAEEKVGYKSFDDLDDFFEDLEA
ncbi:MAG: N-(5'-phosphoribosyl)anthranilate isomerase [Bacteroidota bacterium]